MDKKSCLLLILSLLVVSWTVFAYTEPVYAVQSTPPAPADLIAAVNKLRASRNLPPLRADSALMNAAQAHAVYQASLGYFTHLGAGGTNETNRALAAGYGNGASIVCDEAVALAQLATNVDYVVNTIWNDYEHRELVILNAQYTDAGAGVAEKNGVVYYTLDVCAIQNKGTGEARTATNSEAIIPRQTATPRPNGSIIHVVQTGETVWSIAIAYQVSVDILIAQNGLSTKSPLIYPNQQLLIRPAFTQTVTPTITRTPRPATRTPKPTFTPKPTRPTATINVTAEETKPPESFRMPKLSRQNFALLLIGISVLGILVLLAGGISAKKPPPD